MSIFAVFKGRRPVPHLFPIRIPSRIIAPSAALLVTLFAAGTTFPNAGGWDAVRDIVEQNCISLNKERMQQLLAAKLGPEFERGPSADLLRIMEGVIKRTDFDGIAEEKTVEIIGLVWNAFRKGAPLEYLDDIFDVAYVNAITEDQLAAAANALKEFHRSDVPQEIYEEFVYHSIEDGWEPAAVPVYTRGLIYGVDRGLSPDKIALVLMLDIRREEAKAKHPEQVVLDAIKLVREKEPQKWRPLSGVEKDMAQKADRLRSLERRKRDIDAGLEEKERAFAQAQSELKELREYPASRGSDVDAEKLNRDLERLLRNLQADIAKFQNQRGNIVVELEATRKDVERQQEARDRARKTKRERQLRATQDRIASAGRSGRLNRDKLFASVDRLVGTPYRFGGDSERGMDCSAFTRRVYRSQGIELPRSSREQARVSTPIDSTSVRTGDLIFFDTSINRTISHVGVYLGNGVFAHASSSKGVARSSLKERYYVKRFVKGGRIFND